jgi:hypothetical protein
MSTEILSEITLAKALKYKKRLTGEIARVTRLISDHNSQLKANAANCDVNVSYGFERRAELVQKLIALKVAIYDANRGIMPTLFSLQEMKGEIAFLLLMDVSNGIIQQEYGDSQIEKIAYLGRSDRDQKVNQLQKKIDEAQDAIDLYNNTTKIRVAMETFEDLAI